MRIRKLDECSGCQHCIEVKRESCRTNDVWSDLRSEMMFVVAGLEGGGGRWRPGRARAEKRKSPVRDISWR